MRLAILIRYVYDCDMATNMVLTKVERYSLASQTFVLHIGRSNIHIRVIVCIPYLVNVNICLDFRDKNGDHVSAYSKR